MKKGILKTCLTGLGVLFVLGTLLYGTPAFAIKTASFPAISGKIRFLDKDGTDFSKSLSLQASILKRHSPYSAPMIDTTTPLSVSKSSTANEFDFNLPPFNETTQTWSVQYGISQMAKDFYIPSVSNIRYVKYFVLNEGVPVGYVRHELWGPNKNGQENLKYFLRQSDGSFKGSIDINGNYPENILTFGVSKVVEDFIYPNDSHASQMGDNGQELNYYAFYQQFKEMYEDTSGAAIIAPTGYTQNKMTDVTSDPFTYTMANGSSLPKTYTVGTDIYTYKGWYKGSGNKASIDDTYPPNITCQAEFEDAKDEIHIVYDKKTARTVNEVYVNDSLANINTAWNTTQKIADSYTFTGSPAASKTDSLNVEWEYQGWKLSTEPISALRPKTTPVSLTISSDTTIQYMYKKKQRTITEKFLKRSDSTPISIHSSMGFSNPKTTEYNDNLSFVLSPPTLKDTSSESWNYVGWENVTDNPGVINPVGNIMINNLKTDKEFKYYYSPRATTASIDLTPNPQIINSGGNVSWTSRVTNTHATTLKDLVLKKTSSWSSGLLTPTQITVIPATGASQTFSVTASDWASGVALTGISIPATTNNYADITFSTIATGAVNQVLPAEIELDGNISTPIKADNFVRIDDPDEPNLEPGNAGLINIPTFKFGQVEVKPYAQTKTLSTADYQSGYKPYIRLIDKESMGGWSLTAKLSQFTSGTKTLPTTTSISLKNGDLKEVNNYDKHNESLTSIGAAGNKVIASDGTTVSLTSGGSQGVYQLDYAISDVELSLLGNTGIAGNTYTANMDWTLTTAP